MRRCFFCLPVLVDGVLGPELPTMQSPNQLFRSGRGVEEQGLLRRECREALSMTPSEQPRLHAGNHA